MQLPHPGLRDRAFRRKVPNPRCSHTSDRFLPSRLRGLGDIWCASIPRDLPSFVLVAACSRVACSEHPSAGSGSDSKRHVITGLITLN